MRMYAYYARRGPFVSNRGAWGSVNVNGSRLLVDSDAGADASRPRIFLFEPRGRTWCIRAIKDVRYYARCWGDAEAILEI